MTQWEYNFVHLPMIERWGRNEQDRELASFADQFNALGSEGWELVSYQDVPIYGSMSRQPKSMMLLGIFKRPVPNSA